ncbi:MAG: very short patch repair endonuclease [Lachnospiraceae bacterium]|nr:very short patch repair endonuclease [Lachnospiraceae bacterium]
MGDNITAIQRRRNMQNIKSKDTAIEHKMRKALWHLGIRYRKNYRKLPGKPDICITKYKIAVFCDSSFWHGRDYELRKPIGTNFTYWDNKIRKNMDRDRQVDSRLESMGWIVLHFWDIEINKHIEECIKAVNEAILFRKIGSV